MYIMYIIYIYMATFSNWFLQISSCGGKIKVEAIPSVSSFPAILDAFVWEHLALWWWCSFLTSGFTWNSPNLRAALCAGRKCHRELTQEILEAEPCWFSWLLLWALPGLFKSIRIPEYSYPPVQQHQTTGSLFQVTPVSYTIIFVLQNGSKAESNDPIWHLGRSLAFWISPMGSTEVPCPVPVALECGHSLLPYYTKFLARALCWYSPAHAGITFPLEQAESETPSLSLHSGNSSVFLVSRDAW